MSHTQGNDKIYEELRGYFPPEYDLTPDELEKEIELENKKREIALGMMRVRIGEEDAPKKTDSLPRDVRTSLTHAASDKKPADMAKVSVFDAQTELTAPEKEDELPSFAPPSVYETDNDDISDNEITDPSFEADAEELILIPEAESVEDNELFSGYEPLNELFDEMEDSSSPRSLSENEKTSRKNVLWFFDFLEVFSVCIACIIVIFALFFRLTKVTGESMEDTLYENEYLVVSDLFYEPKCGDIVVLQNTAISNPNLREPLVKRVIAVGGQSVDISSNGMVTVTDEDGTARVLDQPYIKNAPYAGIAGHYDVPEGHVFVMGDNRNHSTDSRSPMVGVIDERCIFGKALVRVLPFDTFTVFENPYKN